MQQGLSQLFRWDFHGAGGDGVSEPRAGQRYAERVVHRPGLLRYSELAYKRCQTSSTGFAHSDSA